MICLCETWLKENQQIAIPGYKWYGQNRSDLSRSAVRGSGGVGVLVSNTIGNQFKVTILDQHFEGILWLSFVDRETNDGFYLAVCYLPPQGSSRGDCSQEFFDTLTSQIFLFGNDNPICICGDFNARVGQLNECPMDSIVSNRPAVDNEKNMFGEVLISFLKDVGFCIVNGRVNSHGDGFTSVSIRGRAVVDYCLVPWNSLGMIKNFLVDYVSDLCEKLNFEEG